MDNVSVRKVRIRTQQKATMKRRTFRILCIVVFCMLVIPLLLSFTVKRDVAVKDKSTGSGNGSRNNQADMEYEVISDRPSGTLHIPMEEYLISMLAQVMEPDQPREAMQALTVLLRTQVIYESEHSGGCFVRNVKLLTEWEKEWGIQAENYLEIYGNAVADTAGIVMTWNGEIMETAYHLVSAGCTRNASETLGQSLPYVVSVNCESDLMAPQYRSTVSFSKKDFFEKLCMLTGNRELTSAELVIEQRDTAGYVTAMTIRPKEADAVQIGGETFRDALGLPSSNFTMEEDADTVSFVCKGVGHGFGMSIYTACEMAKKGNEFMEILQYFYPEAVFMRIA